MTESRSELLRWLNETLQLNYTKIEQCATGAAYCQLMDSIYGDFPLAKVKFNARMEYEFVQNFKVLQIVFDAKNIDKSIPVENLAKCKINDNFEFLLWMKRYWDSHNTGRPYDAAARREPYISNDPPQPTTPKTPRSARSATIKTAYDTSATMQAPSTPSKTRRASTPTPGRDAAEAEVPTRSRTVSLGGIQAAYSNGDGRKISVGSNSGPKTKSKQDDLQAQVAELTARLEEVRVIAKALEKERNFYYKKLRHVESLVQDKLEKGNTGQVPLLKEIEAVLYQTEEGFQKPHVVEQQTPKVQENSVNALTVMPAAAAGLTVEAISPILSLFFGGTSEPAPQPQPQPQPPQQSQQTQQPSPTSSQTKPSLPVSEERGLKSALSLGSAKSSEKLHTQQPPPQLPIKRVAFESDKPPLFFTKFEDLKDLKSLQAALDMAIDSIDDSIDD